MTPYSGLLMGGPGPKMYRLWHLKIKRRLQKGRGLRFCQVGILTIGHIWMIEKERETIP